jgi:hypothetical protein
MRTLNRIKQHWTAWFAVGLAFSLKAYYSRAGADELLWVLAPSAWLAQFVGGIDLVYEQGAGFISHTHHMVVGPAGAGGYCACTFHSRGDSRTGHAGWPARR